MLKKIAAFLLLLAMLLPCGSALCESPTPLPTIAPEIQKRLEEMAPMETEARVTADTLWDEGNLIWYWGDESCAMSSGSNKAVFPMALAPEEAFEALTAAYEEKQEYGTNEVLEAWIQERTTAIGKPQYQAYEFETTERQTVAVIDFSSEYGVIDYSLIFMWQEDEWYLVDVVLAKCIGIQRCGSIVDHAYYQAYFLVFQPVRGAFDQEISLYNLQTRRVEAGYSIAEYGDAGDWEIACYGAACFTSSDGLYIFRRLSLREWDAETGEFVETHAILEDFHYGVDENGSLIRLFDFDPAMIEYPSHG